MAFQCQKCRASPFETAEQLKNHSRKHSPECMVKFLVEGPEGASERPVARDPVTHRFVCPRCLIFKSELPARLQQHCRNCAGGEALDPPVPRLPIHAPGHPPIPENNEQSYISELGYFVNEKFHIVICRDCECYVLVDHIWSHASRSHSGRLRGHRNVDLERLKTDIQRFQLDEGADKLAQYLEHPEILKDPIEGLPVEDGYMCTLCTFYSPSPNTFKSHVSNTHKEGNHSVESCTKGCFMQRLSKGPNSSSSWFGVTTPSCTPSRYEFIFDIISEEAAAQEEEALAAPYKDPRQLPMFMKVLHWDVFIQDMNVDVVEAAALLKADEPGDVRFFPDRLQEVCRSLMMDWQSTVANAEILLRRKVRSTNPMTISPKPFSRLEQSCQDYVRELVHLLIILLRALDSENVEDDRGDIRRMLVPLEEKVQGSLHRLWNGLQAVDEDGQFREDQLEESKLHCMEVLEDLFFIARPSHAIPETSLLIFRFAIFSSMPQHRVVTPLDVTHRISRMMYCCRSLVLHKIVHHALNPGDDVAEVEGGFLFYTREDQRTPFASILQVKRLVRSITKNDAQLPNVIWAGDSDSQIRDGVHVSISHVSALIRCSIQELHLELEEDLLLKMPEYHSNRDRILYNKSGGLIEDKLSDHRNGQWFISNKNNVCSGYTLCLPQHIAGTPELYRRFIESVQVEGTRKIIWKKDALRKWMRRVGKWLQKLMSIIHLVAGQPARGVELLACSTRNTAAQIRGVYYVDGLVMLLTLYGKGDSIRGNHVPVARFLCKKTSFLLINYLTYVRQMEIIASKVLYGPPETAFYNRLLAVQEGQPMCTQTLSNGISSIFLKHLKVYVTIAPWRHMAIAWIHRFLGYTGVPEPTGNGAMDCQAGHSQRVASKYYARSNFDHPNIGRDEFQLYRRVSVEWHRILSLDSDEVSRNLGNNHARLVSPTPSTRGPGEERGPGSRVGQSPVSTTPTADVQHHHHHHHEVKVVHCRGDIGIDHVSLTCSKQVVSGLMALGHTTFKSSHQAQAIARILERQEDLLVVLSTGGGKTLLFLLPAYLERGRYTTVVISPFVALKTELEHRAKKANLSTGVYSGNTCPGGVDILFVSVEHCTMSAFRTHLADLHARKQLGRIVVDECHVALLDRSWRPVLDDIQYIRKSPVPILLLSATVPPKLEGPMRKLFNSNFAVIRAPTNRPNLMYEVRSVQGELGASLWAILSSGSTTPKSIVFSRGKAEAEKVAEMLRARGLAAVHYHADLDMRARNAVHDAWTSGEADIMVATGAFGTGTDSAAVRLVVHLNEPYSVINLAQESGRGGRDGSPSKHIILSAQYRKTQDATMAEYLGGTKCRRWVLQEYVDGQGLDCFSSGSERCDVCESLVGHVQSQGKRTASSSTSESSQSFHGSQHIDLFSSSDDGGTPGTREDHDPPAKRIRLGDALLSESAKGTQDSHADLLLMTLMLKEYLERVKGKCILCTMAEHEVPDYTHELHHCPILKKLCLKCMSNDGHLGKGCTNKLKFKGLECYGCGLPKKLGNQVIHAEQFAGNCKSMGHDKLIPASWFMWRHQKRFWWLYAELGCALDITDSQYTEWLTDAHEKYRTNLVALFICYVANEGQLS